MHAYLMRPSSMKMHIDESCGPKRFDGLVFRDGFATTLYDTEPPFIAGVTINGRVDRPVDGIWQALNEGVIIPLRCAVSKGSFQPTVGNFSFRDYHKSRSPDIEPLDYSFSFWWSRRRNINTQGGYTTHIRRHSPTLSWD